MEYLKQSTAATMSIGPCLDSTGTEYTGLVIGDLTLTKNGTSAAMAAAATLTATSNGFYDLVMTTGNTDTLGRLLVRCNKSTYQIPPREFMVLPASVFDALVTNAANATGGLLAATGAVTGITGTVANTTNTAAGIHVGTIITGTAASAGATTTNVPIKTLSISLTVTDQVKGRVILFKTDTTTAALRGQGAPIDGSSTTAITIAAGNALTTAPAEDDSFTIV